MKLRMAKLNLRVVVVTVGCLGAPVCSAANLSINVGADDPTAADTVYPGTGSTVTTLTDSQTQVMVSVAGRDYGSNPAAGSPRWGLAVGPLPGQPSQDGFLVNGGFSPSATGSTQNATGTAASYVSITLANVLPNTLFENVSLEFQGISSAGTSNAWGAASEGGFANWSVASYSNSGRRLTLDLADFTWTGAGLLEIRLYGLTGQTQGAFTSVRVSARLTSPPAVPEPQAAMLLGAALLLVGRGRRR